jgi:hypothetical protein
VWWTIFDDPDRQDAFRDALQARTGDGDPGRQRNSRFQLDATARTRGARREAHPAREADGVLTPGAPDACSGADQDLPTGMPTSLRQGLMGIREPDNGGRQWRCLLGPCQLPVLGRRHLVVPACATAPAPVSIAPFTRPSGPKWLLHIGHYGVVAHRSSRVARRAALGRHLHSGVAPYADPASFLLTCQQWEPQRLELCDLIGKPASAADALPVAIDELHAVRPTWRPSSRLRPGRATSG